MHEYWFLNKYLAAGGVVCFPQTCLRVLELPQEWGLAGAENNPKHNSRS